MSCGQVAGKLLPGQESRSPDDFELFLEGILEAPRGQREITFPCGYQPAYKSGPSAGQFPCGVSGANDGLGLSCLTGHCGNGCTKGGCSTGSCSDAGPAKSNPSGAGAAGDEAMKPAAAGDEGVEAQPANNGPPTGLPPMPHRAGPGGPPLADMDGGAPE